MIVKSIFRAYLTTEFLGKCNTTQKAFSLFFPSYEHSTSLIYSVMGNSTIVFS